MSDAAGPPGADDRPQPPPEVSPPEIPPSQVERPAPAAPSFWRAVGISVEGVVRNWKACLVVAIPYALLTSIPAQTLQSIGPGLDPADASFREVLVLGALFFAVAGTLVIVSVIVYPPTLAALSLVGDASVLGERAELGSVVRTALDRAASAVGTFLLVVLAVMAPPVAAAVAGLAAGVLLGAEAGLVVGGLALVVSIVPSVFLTVRLWLAVPAVVAEGLGPRDALKRSWGLVRGAFWWVAGVGLLLTIIAAVIASIPQSIAPAATGGAFVLGAVLGAIGMVIQTALTGVGTGVVYSARVLATSGADGTPAPE